jgi:hypothetical protein
MSHKSKLLQSVLGAEGYPFEAGSDPRLLRFKREGTKYVLDADDADPGFFAVRAVFHLDFDLPEQPLLALAHDLGVALKGVKVFVSPDGDAVGFNFEAFVPELSEDTARALLGRGLRALAAARVEFETYVLHALLSAHENARAVCSPTARGPVGLA